MAANIASNGTLKESQGGFDLHTLHWTIPIQPMPASLSKTSSDPFASYSTTIGDYTLKLSLQLVTSAHAKTLSWKKVRYSFDLSSSAMAPEARSETAEGGDGVRRSRDRMDVEVQLFIYNDGYTQPKQTYYNDPDLERWTFTPEDDVKPARVSIQLRFFKSQPTANITTFKIPPPIQNALSLIDGQPVTDVLFVVASSPARPLFASKAALSAASPYFKTMFESGFRESEVDNDLEIASEEEEEPYISGSVLKLVEEASQEMRLASYLSGQDSKASASASKKRKVLEARDKTDASHYTSGPVGYGGAGEKTEAERRGRGDGLGRTAQRPTG